MTMTESERARRVQSASRVRLVLAVLGTLVPLLLGALFRRQQGRLDALAAHGVAVEGRVIEVTRASSITHYAYRVDATEYTWNVASRDAPFEVGAALPVLYLPEVPSFSRPTHDRAAVASDAERNRSFAWKVLLGIAVFFWTFAYLPHREVGRLRAHAPSELDDPALYRERVRVTLGVLGVLALAISAFHYSDARAKGESPWPVAIALALTIALVGGVTRYVSGKGAHEASARAARLTRWLVPVAIVVALLRAASLLAQR